MVFIHLNKNLSISELHIKLNKKINFFDYFEYLELGNDNYIHQIPFSDCEIIDDNNNYKINLSKFYTKNFNYIKITNKLKYECKVIYNKENKEKGIIYNKFNLMKRKRKISNKYLFNIDISFDFIGISVCYNINKIIINGVEYTEKLIYSDMKRGEYKIEIIFLEDTFIENFYIYFITYDNFVINDFINKCNNYFSNTKCYEDNEERICSITRDVDIEFAKFKCCNQFISKTFLKEYIYNFNCENIECPFCRNKNKYYKSIEFYKKIEK